MRFMCGVCLLEMFVFLLPAVQHTIHIRSLYDIYSMLRLVDSICGTCVGCCARRFNVHSINHFFESLCELFVCAYVLGFEAAPERGGMRARVVVVVVSAMQ